MEIVLGNTPNVDISKLEEELNKTKDKIGKLNNWDHVKFGNPLFQLKTKNITFGYLKLYEILYKYKLINERSELDYFDACSFPGTFIFCVLNYCNKIQTKVNWHAVSLISDLSLDDLYKLYQKYPERWMMNDKNNGDITDLKNIKDIIARVGKVDLYTGDFGIEVYDDYNKQEEICLQGLRNQIKLGLGMMREGGNMIIKCFTLFNEKSQLYISWMYSCFEKTYAYKPYASSDSNSEIYIIGVNFIKKIPLGKNIKRIDLSYPISVFTKNQIHRINYYEKCLLEREDIIYPINGEKWLTLFN